MFKYLLLGLCLLLNGCSYNNLNTSLPLKKENDIESNQKKEEFYKVIGIATNHNNIYMQRVEAQAKARAELSSILNVKITSIIQKEYLSKSKNIKSETQLLSKSLLRNTSQSDIYFDKNKTMYLTMSIKEEIVNEYIKSYYEKKDLNNKIKDTKKYKEFNKKALLHSKCYKKEVLKKLLTKAKIYKSYPSWFYNPNENHNIGGIGIAKKIKGKNFYFQKKLAYTLALNDLSKNENSKVIVKSELKKELKNNKFEKSFSSSSKQSSSSLMKRVYIKDMFLDVKTCDLYVWAVRK